MIAKLCFNKRICVCSRVHCTCKEKKSSMKWTNHTSLRHLTTISPTSCLIFTLLSCYFIKFHSTLQLLYGFQCLWLLLTKNVSNLNNCATFCLFFFLHQRWQIFLFLLLYCRNPEQLFGETRSWRCRNYFHYISSILGTKQSDGEASIMLELWRMWSTPLLPSLPGPLWLGVIVPDRVLSMS